MSTEDKINLLDDFMAKKEVARLEYVSAMEKIIPPMPKEVVDALAELEAEYQGKVSAVDSNIEKLKKEITAEVLQVGKSVKGLHLQAVWGKGRTSWDTGALDGYGAAHPEILQFKKVGEPSVTIIK